MKVIETLSHYSWKFSPAKLFSYIVLCIGYSAVCDGKCSVFYEEHTCAICYTYLSFALLSDLAMYASS